MTAATVAVLLTLVSQAGAIGPSSPAGASLRAGVTSDPDAARERITDLLVRAERRGAAGRRVTLDSAAQLAAAYYAVWHDSAPARTVGWYRGLPSARRALKRHADSLRAAGNRAFVESGPETAVALWRRSYEAAERGRDTAGMAGALGNIGSAFHVQGALDSAVYYQNRAQLLAASLSDWRTVGNALGALATIARESGDHEQARTLYSRASLLRERVGDTRGLAADHNNLGLLAQENGDLALADASFRRALALNTRYARDGAAATNLVNLAGVATLRGQLDAAAEHYARALALQRRASDRSGEAHTLHGAGLLALRRGDPRAAEALFADAIALRDQLGLVHEEIESRLALAAAAQAAGDPTAAGRQLESARALQQRHELPPQVQAQIALSEGDLAAELNDDPRAERAYRSAEVAGRRGGDDATVAAALTGRGLLRLRRSDGAGALQPLTLAIGIAEGQGDQHSASAARLLLGYAYRLAGDTSNARAAYLTSIEEFSRLEDVRAEAAGLEALGQLELEAGSAVAAESLFARGVALVAEGDPAPVLWRLHEGTGGALLAQRRTAEAATAFEAAVDVLEMAAHAIWSEDRRSAWLEDKWSAHTGLARTRHLRGEVNAAFAASERLRSRHMVGMLARGAIAGRTLPADLAGEERALSRRIASLTAQLAERSAESQIRGPDMDAAPQGAEALREGLARAQAAYAELLTRAGERHPVYAAEIADATVGASEVASTLHEGEALVEYLIDADGALAFVVTPRGIRAVSLPTTRGGLRRTIAFATSVLARRDSAGRELWRGPLSTLYAQLVAPLERSGALAGVKRLIVVPHGELHHVPFAALVAGESRGFLVEKYDIAYVPSASVLARLRERAIPAPGRSAKVLAFAPLEGRLPGAEAEVEAIGRLHGSRATIVSGAAATEGALRELAGAQRHSVVHIATYGVLNRHNPLFSFVELAADSADDGRLETHEVFALRMSADLVILSACQTGLSAGAREDVPAGDDWVGLVRAFLFAGADRVIATHWAVDDRATAVLMTRLHESLVVGTEPSAALAAVQRSMLREPDMRDPYLWAAFAVSGR